MAERSKGALFNGAAAAAIGREYGSCGATTPHILNGKADLAPSSNGRVALHDLLQSNPAWQASQLIRERRNHADETFVRRAIIQS